MSRKECGRGLSFSEDSVDSSIGRLEYNKKEQTKTNYSDQKKTQTTQWSKYQQKLVNKNW